MSFPGLALSCFVLSLSRLCLSCLSSCCLCLVLFRPAPSLCCACLILLPSRSLSCPGLSCPFLSGPVLVLFLPLLHFLFCTPSRTDFIMPLVLLCPAQLLVVSCLILSRPVPSCHFFLCTGSRRRSPEYKRAAELTERAGPFTLTRKARGVVARSSLWRARGSLASARLSFPP